MMNLCLGCCKMWFKNPWSRVTIKNPHTRIRKETNNKVEYAEYQNDLPKQFVSLLFPKSPSIKRTRTLVVSSSLFPFRWYYVTNVIFLTGSVSKIIVYPSQAVACVQICRQGRFNYDLICKIDDSYFHERAISIRITLTVQ